MDLTPISVITGGILLVLGTAFAIFLGLASDKIEATRPH